MDEKDEDVINYLLLNGALEPAGVSETGEPMYNFTPKLQHVLPELYKEHVKHVNSELMGLWEKGFINMDLFDDNPTVTLSNKAFDDTEISKLSEEDQFSIREIKRILLQK